MPFGSTSLTVVAAASVLTSGWAAGLGAGFSLFGVPVILTGSGPSEIMMRQWRALFLRGSSIMPGMGLLNALIYLTIAYRCRSLGLEWRGFASAGVSMILLIPYTLIFMMGTYNKLLAASAPDTKDKKTLTDDSARSLIQKWGDLNLVRAVVSIIGTGLALWNLCL